MKLIVYGLRDTLVSETGLILTERKDELMKRNVKALLLDKRPNPINSHTKDTQIFALGELDTDTGILTGYASPRFAFSVEQVRLDLLEEIRASKVLAGENIDGDTKLPVEED